MTRAAELPRIYTNAAWAALRQRLTEAALARFDLSHAVQMLVDTAEVVDLRPGRVSLAVLSLHPSLAGVGFTWRRGAPEITRTERPWGFLETKEHLESPLHVVMTTRRPLRLRIHAGEGLARFPVIREFAAEGATDYVAFPLISPRPDIHVLTLWTDRPGGWDDAEIDDLERVMPTLALVIEVAEAHRVTSRERVELMLLAHTDRMTQLLNRHGLLLEAESRFGPGRPCLAICIDLDGVKGVNDRLGHHFGDVAIQTAAERIRSALPEGALAGRMGGDEFLVFADHQHTSLAEALRATLAEVYLVKDVRCQITASVGVAGYDRVSIEDLARRADAALLESKRSGRNRVSYYLPDTVRHQQRSERISRLLPAALERGEFRVAIQPIVELATGKIVHGECLARWTSPELGDVGPDEFIPLAEQSGDIVLLDRFMIRSAASLLGRWGRDGQRPIRLAVNISPKESSLHHLDRDIAEALATHGVAPSRLMVEITESVFIDRMRSAEERLDRLRALGVAVALDDFGTGYSSLSYLQRLPFDFIKLDRSLVAPLPDERAGAIVDSLVRLSRALRVEIVAEGVETPEQDHLLSGLGCRYAQGYRFWRPLEVAAWEQAVSANQEADR